MGKSVNLYKSLMMCLVCLYTFGCAGFSSRHEAQFEKGTPFGQTGSGNSVVPDDIAGGDDLSGKASDHPAERSDIVRIEKGDLVEVNYTAKIEDGKIFQTTRAKKAGGPESQLISWYMEPDIYSPYEFIAGKQGAVPGMSDLVVGMQAGEKTFITLPPENAYGISNPKSIMSFPCVKKVPKVLRMSPKEYIDKFAMFPVKGETVNVVPYFKSKILEVSRHYTILEMLAQDKIVEDKIGNTTIQVGEEYIEIRLEPKMGAPFELEKRQGRITSSDGKNFTVDFNHPLAGHSVTLELEVVSMTKASVFSDIEIPWIEDYEQALETAQQKGKPVVLVLYAAWCGWSKRLMSESLEDIRVRRLRDAFIWAKVDSDVERGLKEIYEQEGFPAVVLLSSDGEAVKKIEGYKDASSLSRELNQVLDIYGIQPQAAFR